MVTSTTWFWNATSIRVCTHNCLLFCILYVC